MFSVRCIGSFYLCCMKPACTSRQRLYKLVVPWTNLLGHQSGQMDCRKYSFVSGSRLHAVYTNHSTCCTALFSVMYIAVELSDSQLALKQLSVCVGVCVCVQGALALCRWTLNITSFLLSAFSLSSPSHLTYPLLSLTLPSLQASSSTVIHILENVQFRYCI